MYPPAPPQPKSHAWLIIVIVVVVVVVIIAVFAALVFFTVHSAIQSAGVDVSAVHWSGTNACGGLANNFTIGFVGPEGGTTLYSLTVYSPYNCTIHTVTATTSGFSISNPDVDLPVTANSPAALSFTIKLPSTVFIGTLDLVIS